MKFIARQPNGKLCRFSTTVDTITNYDMTDEEYIELCAEEAREVARQELKYCLLPFDEVKNSFSPSNDTIEEFEELLKEMGDYIGLGYSRIQKLREIEDNTI